MTESGLAAIYRSYIDCLNRQDWAALGQFVHEDAHHNGRPFGLAGYRAMLENDFGKSPTCSSPSISWSASRLASPRAYCSIARRPAASSASPSMAEL